MSGGPTPVALVLPEEGDLPGRGWLAVDDGFEDLAGGTAGVGEAIDCVGPRFPEGDEVAATAATPHWIRSPGTLLHAFALSAATGEAADRAEAALSSTAFATCLGRSVAADLDADADGGPELLAVDVTATDEGHRVAFVGSAGDGVRPVTLDVVCVRRGTAVGLLWFADTPGPFDEDARRHVLDRIAHR